MGAKISISGALPKSFALSRTALKEAAGLFAERASRRAARPFRAVAVVLQGDAESACVHKAVFDDASATDVITQAYDPMPPEPEGVYGELYVNVDRAAAYAQTKGSFPKEKELLLYVAHGMDHLSGADDATPRERLQMRRRELKWVREAWTKS